jgi:hypothetical protein
MEKGFVFWDRQVQWRVMVLAWGNCTDKTCVVDLINRPGVKL